MHAYTFAQLFRAMCFPKSNIFLEGIDLTTKPFWAKGGAAERRGGTRHACTFFGN